MTSAMHKILLAEDDNDMRRFLVKALENAGFKNIKEMTYFEPTKLISAEK